MKTDFTKSYDTNTSRTKIIQDLIDLHGYKTYLEIGVQNGKNFNAIKCDKKAGVDPDTTSKATVHCTSDIYFDGCKEIGLKYDIIFIDGLHHWEQVLKDIENALDCLNEGGAIVCHDMNPITEASQAVPRVQSHWNGDCWIAWVKLRGKRSDLDMFVINCDEGCGVITKGSQRLVPEKFLMNLTYRNLELNRSELLNLIDVRQV